MNYFVIFHRSKPQIIRLTTHQDKVNLRIQANVGNHLLIHALMDGEVHVHVLESCIYHRLSMINQFDHHHQ